MRFFVAGTKGGVGKSFASAMLAGAAEDLGLSRPFMIRTMRTGRFATLMKEHCRFLDEQKETYPLDEVINSLYESSPVTVTIVDMKAGTSRSTQEWFSSVPWDALRKLDVDVYVAGCVTSDPDSVRTFGPWLEYFHNIVFRCIICSSKTRRTEATFLSATPCWNRECRKWNWITASFSYRRLSRTHRQAQ